MIPIRQTTFGYGKGNCFEACVASILEIPLREVCEVPRDDTWLGVFEAWMRSRGFMVMCSQPDHPPKGYSIAGITIGGCAHAYVALDGQIVHEPQTGRTSLGAPIEDYLYWERL